jgi:PKD repeat protein
MPVRTNGPVGGFNGGENTRGGTMGGDRVAEPRATVIPLRQQRDRRGGRWHRLTVPVRLLVATLAVLTTALGVTAVRAAAAGNAPVAGRDVARAFRGTSISINVTSNDYDPDGESFSLVSVATPAHGSVSSIGSSSFTYTPVSTFSGTETITYTIRDSANTSATGTVIVQVDAGASGSGQPTPADDYFVTAEGVPLSFTGAEIAANDTDPQGQTSTLVAIGDSTSKGTVTGSGPFTFSPRVGFTGQDKFEYLVVDGDGHVGVGEVFVQVVSASDTNRAPVARRDVARVFSGTETYVATSGNDSDPDGHGFSVVSVDRPAHGSVRSFGSSYFFFTPDVGFSGLETVRYTIRDSLGLLASSTVSLWVDTGVSGTGQPTPADDYFVTTEGTPLSFTAAQLSANDSDPQGQVVSIVDIADSTNNGQVTGSVAAGFTFSPRVGFTGQDKFEYLVVDGDGHVGVGEVFVQVVSASDTNRAPVARRDVARVFSGTETYVATSGNDSDPDGHGFSVVSVDRPAHGSVRSFGSSYFFFTPDVGFSGLETVRYTIRDSLGLLASSTVSLWVDTGVSGTGQPTPADDYFVTTEGTPLSFTAAQLSANDSDPQGQVVSIVDIADSTNLGIVEGSVASGFTFTPSAGFTGQDTFEYLVVDPQGHVAVGEGFVQVVSATSTNRPPVAVADVAASPSGAQVYIPVTSNDSDPDGNGFSLVSVSSSARGTTQLSSGGLYYTPDASFTGVEVLTYVIRDSFGLLGSGTVTITVRGGTNRPPVAVPQYRTVAPGGTLSITLSGSDPENSALTYAVVAPPNGSLVGASPTYTYTAPATAGTDLIVFTANDGSLTSAPAGVFITVGANKPPVARSDSATTAEDVGVSIPVLANDDDLDADTLTITGVISAPTHGAATCAASGCSYIGAPNFSGADSFTYGVADGRGGSASATVSVTVTPVDDAPVADDVSAPATAGPITLTATDVDSATLTFEVVAVPGRGSIGAIGAPSCQTAAGVTTCTASVTYTRAPGDVEEDSFTYRASDGTSDSSVATVTVASTNAAPTASLQVAPVVGTAPLATTATITGADDNGDPLTFTLDHGDGTPPATGTLPVAPIAHTYTGAGLYTTRLEVSDGRRTAVVTGSVTVGLSEPLTARAGDDRSATVGAAVAFDGAASRPLIGIETYSWDFGDGSGPVTGPQAEHTFTTAGRRTVTLTVTSGSSTATDTLLIDVLAPPAVPGLDVRITGQGSPLAGADVAVIDADGVRYRAVTGADGRARLDHLRDGKYTAYGIKPGYKPGVVSATVVGGSGSVELDLVSGAIAQTELTSTRLTRDEIIEAGIDPNDPQNQNVFEFEVHLLFGPDELTFSGYATGDGFYAPSFGGGGPGCAELCGGAGDYVAYPRLEQVQGVPTILWMIVPGRAKWLKEFFEVQMLVTNLADESFTFENGQASLGQLPDGLSLAPTEDPQELVQSLPDIAGGATERASWIVRGDAEGLYELAADYSATLEPIGTSVLLQAATAEDALRVWGGSALTMTVDVDDRADTGAPYRLRIGLTNVSTDAPAYNPEVELLTDNKVNYIYQPKERFTRGTDVIEPGETFWTDYYRLVPAISGTIDLSQSFVKKTAGNVDVVSTIVTHPATPLGDLPSAEFAVEADGVHLTWDPVPQASGYEIFRTPDRAVDFEALPIATLGPETTSAVLGGLVDGFFAISSVIGGVNTMAHPMVGIPGTVGPPAVRPTITVTDVAIPEGDAGPTSAEVEVRLSAATTVPVTVKYKSADVSAVAPADYVAIPETTVVFAPGEVAKSISVTVNGDEIGEKGENFAVKLYDAIGAVIGDNASKVSILEDDGPVTIAIDDAHVVEGDSGSTDLVATVRLSSPLAAGQSVKAKYRTAPGTAAAGSDFATVPLTPITFAPGEQSKTVSVAVSGDVEVEANETFSLVLQGVVGAQVADPLAKATIVTNDGVRPRAASGDHRDRGQRCARGRQWLWVRRPEGDPLRAPGVGGHRELPDARRHRHGRPRLHGDRGRHPHVRTRSDDGDDPGRRRRGRAEGTHRVLQRPALIAVRCHPRRLDITGHDSRRGGSDLLVGERHVADRR